MNQADIMRLFADSPFADAKARLAEEAKKNGWVPTGDTSMADLMRMAAEPSRSAAVPVSKEETVFSKDDSDDAPVDVVVDGRPTAEAQGTLFESPASHPVRRNTPSWKTIATEERKKAEELAKKVKELESAKAVPVATAPVLDVKAVAAAVAEALKPKDEAPSSATAGPRKDPIELANGANSWKPKTDVSKTNAVNLLKKFLSEFSLWSKGVSARFVNTFCATDFIDRTAFVTAYAEVSKDERLDDLKAKLTSPEWSNVLKAFSTIKAAHLNKRLACFYGEPGGGKTYQAIALGKDANGDGNVAVMPCHAGMDPSQLLFEYKMDYETGKKGFVPSALLIAMTEGRALVMDEINLLPTESVMFLQNITDNKDEVFVMGQSFKIEKGFFVIGTMNIETGLGVIPLPPALADRCAVIKEFKMTSEQLVYAAGL